MTIIVTIIILVALFFAGYMLDMWVENSGQRSNKKILDSYWQEKEVRQKEIVINEIRCRITLEKNYSYKVTENGGDYSSEIINRSDILNRTAKITSVQPLHQARGWIENDVVYSTKFEKWHIADSMADLVEKSLQEKINEIERKKNEKIKEDQLKDNIDERLRRKGF